ncbi:uncharacterized protein LOC128954541 isoform X2 [Oppia nitens]|uniref:uncharacterized protein LOC128954541 isoform X2 n=1 Tax=Oppia nitens TaxID=1686743 RepID=UPI0023DA9849|nr:uncharacterized protein LOC128954541 isoform X2 [Oppia nitens]
MLASNGHQLLLTRSAKSLSNKLLIIICLNIIIPSMVISSALDDKQIKPIFSQQIDSCEKNTKGSTLMRFTSQLVIQIEDAISGDKDLYDLVADGGDGGSEIKSVKLKKPVENETFDFRLIFGDTTAAADQLVVGISGHFVRNCDDSYSSSCTVIIAFLSSLCLILFTALALALIILRRKKPITFKFGQRGDGGGQRESIQYNDGVGKHENYNENHVNKEPSGGDVTANNGHNFIINSVHNSPLPPSSQPRKSSLKPSTKRNSISDPSSVMMANNNNNTNTIIANNLNLNNNNYDNVGFTGGDLEVVPEINEDIRSLAGVGLGDGGGGGGVDDSDCGADDDDKPPTMAPPKLPEVRRKSIVTFCETTQINYG